MINPNENTIVIIGLSASGKTTLSDELQEQFSDYSLYHSDDYMHFGFEESLYKMMSDIRADSNPKKIIEGVQGYRLLRKGLQTCSFLADLVITCECDPDIRIKRYEQRGNQGKKLNGFDKTLQKIYDEYLVLLKYIEEKPRFLTINTD